MLHAVRRFAEVLRFTDFTDADIERFTAKIPGSLMSDAELYASLRDLNEILEFKSFGRHSFDVVDDTRIGYVHYSKDQLKEVVAELEFKLKVHPNYMTFYSLSKVLSVLGETKKRKSIY
jgi:hypothetical protein